MTMRTIAAIALSLGVASPALANFEVMHNWNSLVNAGVNGAVNDAVLVNNGANPTVGGGFATVVNGNTPGPGAGGDDGYISLGVVPQFQGATYFELGWAGLDLNESAGTSNTLGGALTPGFSAGSQMILSVNGVNTGVADLRVSLYEAGGSFGGGDPNEVLQDVNFNDVLPVTPTDLRIVFSGNGLTRSQGGAGLVQIYVNDALVGAQATTLGVLNPSEAGAAFGLGKYHNGSSVAGAYTTGAFSIRFTPIPEPSTALLAIGAAALLRRRG